MLYEPPFPWTEDELITLSGEDDRYEFKSGGILFEESTGKFKEDNKLSNELAVEICAFANSFGGTLFLGVKNKNKKIDGIQKFYKDNLQNALKEWLDKKINHLLEFRLPKYRVSEVKLSPETQSEIGDDKVVIAIDVFDSDLAPHQAKFDNKYYYRQSSESNPAPHHYLSYLWSRTSQNQSEAVRVWCQRFLNPLVGHLISLNRTFYERNFDPYKLYDFSSWLGLFGSLTADQFLRTFPNIVTRLKDFPELFGQITFKYQELKDFIKKSSHLNRLVSDAYSRRHPDQIVQLSNASVKEKFEWYCDTCGAEKLSYEEALNFIPQFIASNALQTKAIAGTNELRKLQQCVSADLSELTSVDETAKEILGELEHHIQELLQKTRDEVAYLSDFRYELCLRHNTTYE